MLQSLEFIMKKTKTIKLETLDKLCNALNCRIQDIFEHVPDKD